MYYNFFKIVLLCLMCLILVIIIIQVYDIIFNKNTKTKNKSDVPIKEHDEKILTPSINDSYLLQSNYNTIHYINQTADSMIKMITCIKECEALKASNAEITYLILDDFDSDNKSKKAIDIRLSMYIEQLKILNLEFRNFYGTVQTIIDSATKLTYDELLKKSTEIIDMYS